MLSVAEGKIAVVDTVPIFEKFFREGTKKSDFGKYFKNIIRLILARFKPLETHCLRGSPGANPYLH